MSNDILTSMFINFRALMFKLASGIVGQDDADDVIHDVFCRLWSRHPNVESEEQALKLGYTAVKNAAIDSLRRAGVRQTVAVEDVQVVDESDDSAAERQQTYDAVVELSRRVLSGRQLDVFELYDIKGVEYGKVAEQLGMTPENVRVTLSRARKTIRELYKKQYES